MFDTTSADGNGRCNALPVDTWATEHRAPRYTDRCPNRETQYVSVRDELGGLPREQLMRLCDGHADEARRQPGFVFARPLATT